MAIHKLSARKVDTALTGKYDDGGGLRLVVSATGSRKWVLRFTIDGKRREMGLGSYPDVGLSKARELASEYRKQVKDGIDPIEARKNCIEEIPSFAVCAKRFIEAHQASWKNMKHRQQWVNTIQSYANPVIGDKPIDTISTADILLILREIWTTKTETAKRLQGRLENILDYASAHGYLTKANPARWRGHLDKLLPKPTRIKKIAHHPAMPYEEVAAFMHLLEGHRSTSSKALAVLIHTATRSSEVLKATWDEIDLEASIWTIPSERMKAGREHRIPLSKQCRIIFHDLPRISGNPYVFPGNKAGCPLSNMSLLQLMRGMGFGVNGEHGDYVPHGFRSSFRDWSGEVSSFPRDVAEMALAHTIGNKVEAAYRRGDLFEKRCEMMQAWSDYISHT